MGVSTISLQMVDDYVAGHGIPTPLTGPSGYGMDLALSMATDLMSDLISERFNWKWNRKAAPAFYTNSWQQDYPQIGITDIGWIEDCDQTQINSTSLPKPIWNPSVVKQLSRSSQSIWRPDKVCWMYNSELSYGSWPGAGVVYSPLVGVNAPQKQNPLMSMIDANGNLLILTGFGTTGSAAPSLPASSAEGATVTDGSCTWTVVNPNGMGFRLSCLPGGTGPTYQMIVYYQAKPVSITSIDQLLSPIPDDQARHFKRGYRAACVEASPNPGDRQRFPETKADWLNALAGILKDADKELNVYGLIPATSVVEPAWGYMRNPQDPSQPF